MKIKQLQVSALLLGSLLLGACGQSTMNPGGTGGDSTGGTSTGGTSTPGNSTGGTSTGGTSTPTSTVPNPFAFVTTYATGGQLVSSNSITVGGLSAPTTLTYTSDGTATLYVNGQPVNSPVTVKNGDTVQLKVIAAGTQGAAVTTTLNIAGYSGVFKVITGTPPLVATLSPSSATVIEGQVVHFTTNVRPNDGYTFESSCDIRLTAVHAQGQPSCGLTNVTPTSADFSSNDPGTYVINLVDKNGNVVASSSVTVRDIEVVYILAMPNPVDVGQNTTLSSTVTGSTAGVTYSIVSASNGGDVSKAKITGDVFSASQVGSYLVRATSNEDSNQMSNTTIFVRDIQVSGVQASPNPVNVNSPATLSSTLTGSTGGVTYTVTDASNGGDVTKASIDGNTFMASQAGTYTVTASSNDEPSKTSSTTVTVQEIQVSNVQTSPNSPYQEQATTLSATVTGSSQGVTYMAKNPSGQDVTASEIAGSTFTPQSTGNYTITATSKEDSTKSASTTVTVQAGTQVVQLDNPEQNASTAVNTYITFSGHTTRPQDSGNPSLENSTANSFFSSVPSNCAAYIRANTAGWSTPDSVHWQYRVKSSPPAGTTCVMHATFDGHPEYMPLTFTIHF